MKPLSHILFSALLVAVTATTSSLRFQGVTEEELGRIIPAKIFHNAIDMNGVEGPFKHKQRQLKTRVYDIEKTQIGFLDSSILLSSGRYSLWYNMWPKLDTYKNHPSIWDNTVASN
jgi:hypothetical protein